jgi:hypothetical protein
MTIDSGLSFVSYTELLWCPERNQEQQFSLFGFLKFLVILGYEIGTTPWSTGPALLWDTFFKGEHE